MIRQLHTIESINERIEKHNICLTAVRFDVPMSVWYGPKRVICRCKCGVLKAILIKPLLQGQPKSCGCLRHEKNKGAFTIEQINEKKKSDKLTAIGFADPHINKSGTTSTRVLCLCVCGRQKAIHMSSLLSGDTTSCGCIRKGVPKYTKFSHTIRPIYDCYRAMMVRCYDETRWDYKSYGAIGVTVCEEWKNSYQSFLTWCVENGWKKGLQLDKDIKGNGMLYSPETCCFVTQKENCNNRTTSVLVTYKGITDTIAMTTERLGLRDHQSAISERIRSGWSIDKVFSTPIRKMEMKPKLPPPLPQP